jgi:hypothetical protein
MTTRKSFGLFNSTSTASMTMMLASSRKPFTRTPGSSTSTRTASSIKTLISEFFAMWAAPPGWDVVGQVLSMTRVGDAAGVQLSWKRGSNEFIDFHNLLRINGIWKITNNTATHSSR